MFLHYVILLNPRYDEDLNENPFLKVLNSKYRKNVVRPEAEKTLLVSPFLKKQYIACLLKLKENVKLVFQFFDLSLPLTFLLSLSLSLAPTI